MKIDIIQFLLKKRGIGKWQRQSTLIIVFVIIIPFFLWLDPSDLPDYDSYSRIYLTSFIGGDWEIFFTLVNFYFREIGRSYSDFRHFIFIFSSLSLFLVLSRVETLQYNKTILVSWINLVFLFVVVAVFMLEYFLIRIRAGFAIGLICFAIYSLMSKRVYYGRIVAFLFISLAFFTHKSTTIILLVFILVPLARIMLSGISRNKNILNFIISAFSIVLLFYMINSSYADRGEHVLSPLNPFRFVMVSIVPLVLYYFTKNECRLITTMDNPILGYPSNFLHFYIFIAFGLAFMFFAGMTETSGEALVRVITLSSVPALISVQISGTAQRAKINAYILAINVLFFLATLNII